MGRWIAGLAVILWAGLASAERSAGSFEAAFTSFPNRPSVVESWRLVPEKEQGHVLVFEDDFAAKKGPDVKLFLSPIPADQVTGDNATEGSLFVVQLERFEGAQRFVLPPNTDIAQFRSVILHCEAYSKLWGTGDLVGVGQ